jgi:hypothetical protein
MAIVFQVDEAFEPAPFIDNMGTTIAEFELGQEPPDSVVVMSTMLLPGAACQEGADYIGAFDLRFGIRLRDAEHDWKFTAPDFTTEARDKYIRPEDRAIVRAGICKALGALLQFRSPEQVTMSTYYANLPPEGLAKYNDICAQSIGVESASPPVSGRSPATLLGPLSANSGHLQK